MKRDNIPNDFYFKLTRPAPALSAFVESFWQLHNASDTDKEIVIVPDGRIDLTFSRSATEAFHVTRSGLETCPVQVVLPAKTLIYAISFKLPATEYIFQSSIAAILNSAERLPADFWGFGANDLSDFEAFSKKASDKIASLLVKETDERKMKLFDLMYSSNGSMTVKELSKSVYWSSRQIARYFTEQFGLPPKAYCNIIRFRASLEHLAADKFFPDLSFADQSHFIREIKKFSGVSPKELKRNQNDRFIQFLAITAK